MKTLFSILCAAFLFTALLPVASAEEGYIDNKQCGACHKPHRNAFQATAHGRAFEGDAARGCQSCHGGGAAHKEVAGQDDYKGPMKIEAFKKAGGSSPDGKNARCLACHSRDANRSHWMGSTHQSRDVACVSCHQIHAERDNVRDKRTQPEVCYTCHKEQRAQANKPSHHPVPEGKMGCSDCHNAHGSAGPKLMKRDSVNDTCYACHMEKRGPFVYNHQPVSEDCSICHNPHGAVQERMLKMRPPFLCHQCHSPHAASNLALGGQVAAPATIGRNQINYTQGRGCVNCHTEIHGSNNPANAAGDPNPQFNLR